MARTKGNVPVQKVQGVALAGAITTIVIWVLNTWVLDKGQLIPGTVSAAATTILAAFIGYMTPPGKNEQIIP